MEKDSKEKSTWVAMSEQRPENNRRASLKIHPKAENRKQWLFRDPSVTGKTLETS